MAKKTTKANEAAQVVAVDVTILSQGMKRVFEGCALIFDSIGANQAAEQMSCFADKQVEAAANEKAEENTDASPVIQEGAKVKGDAEASAEKEVPAGAEEDIVQATENTNADVAISIEDLQKVAAQKITVNRKNSAKIQSLVKAYGSAKLSDIPEAKREAFLNDLAQL